MSHDRPLVLALAAEESAGVQLVRALAATPHRLVAVLTSGAAVRQAAEQVRCPLWPATAVRDPAFAQQLQGWGVDLLLNAHSLYVIDGAVLAAPKLGTFNVHPGALPQYAGLNTVSWAIYNGERTQGVTVHRATPRIDAGPIAYQETLPIEDSDSAFTLGAKCSRLGITLMLRLVATAAANPALIPAHPQDASRRRYFGRRPPQGGRLDWSRPGVAVVNFVRACNYGPFPSPWGHPATSLDGVVLRVLQAERTERITDHPPGTVGARVGAAMEVASADQWVLVRRVMNDERAMDAAEVLRPGQRFEPMDAIPAPEAAHSKGK